MTGVVMGKFVVQRRVVKENGILSEFIWASGCFYFQIPYCDQFVAEEFCKNNPRITFADKVIAVRVGV